MDFVNYTIVEIYRYLVKYDLKILDYLSEVFCSKNLRLKKIWATKDLSKLNIKLSTIKPHNHIKLN